MHPCIEKNATAATAATLERTHLAVQSVAELGNAAGDLVKVNRLFSAVALDDIKGHPAGADGEAAVLVCLQQGPLSW